ncbi:RDD family protein [Cellulomonas citrea]|uniref:RDD family protein n=1 Tax=Cellulomonas citrea TaxID=1909423 RepID=UPI001356E975|nr:RDD family protein [Cellulomonas citrea]
MGDPGAHIAPGWYEQAGRPGVLVYFDGRAWTAHTRPKPGPPAAAPAYDPGVVAAPVDPVATPPVVVAPTQAAPPAAAPAVVPTGPTFSWQPQPLPPEQLGPQDGGATTAAPAAAPAAWTAPATPGLPTMRDPLSVASAYSDPSSRFGTPPGPAPFGAAPQASRFGTPPGPSPLGGSPQTSPFGAPPGQGGSAGGPGTALPPGGGPYAPPTAAPPTGAPGYATAVYGAPQGPMVPVGAPVPGWQNQPPPSGPPLSLSPVWSGQPGAGFPAYAAPGWAPAPTYAHWGWRVLAHVVDTLVVNIPTSLLSFAIGLSWALSHPGAQLSDEQSMRLELPGYVLSLLIWFVNRCVIAGRTGRSLGRVVTGTRLVRESTGRPLGVWLAFVREIAGILNVLPLFLGFLWPLWDAKRQAFSDKAVGSLVLR